MFKNVLRSMPAIAVLVALVVSLVPAGFAAAEDASVTLVAQFQEEQAVVLDVASASEISSLDPAAASDAVYAD